MDFWQNKVNRWVIFAGIIFSILNMIFIVTENFWGLLLPLGALLVAMMILSLDKVLLFLVFTVPLSIFYFNPNLHVGFTLPTEPILFGVMILFFIKFLFQGGFDSKVLGHPLSIAIILMLVWMFITSVSSEMPIVSFKYFAARLWFVVVFFYMMTELFKTQDNIKKFFWIFMIPLAAVVIYTMYVHSQNGFTKESSTWVMFPFFKEHTSYGAVLAMYVPIAFAFAFLLKNGLNNKILGIILFLILTIGVIFSFTRAAWLSLVVASLAALVIYLKMSKAMFYSLVLAFFATLWYFQGDLVKKFEKNDQVSSDNLTEHVESMSNISTDASNLERINRWKSAFRMFSERPILGFGPGTYMFLYAPYQKPSEKTIISTNSGNMGNAHSEYIGPLAESGILGFVFIAILVFITISTGIRVYYKMESFELKIIAMASLMGLITYWTHGFLNNFLEMDKASCPVWGFSAVLVILDLHYGPKKNSEPILTQVEH